MKTLDFFNELKNIGINATMFKAFAYSIHKDKRYYCVTIDTVPTRDIIALAARYNIMWVARTYVNTENGINHTVKFEAMPEDMKSFDFVD